MLSSGMQRHLLDGWLAPAVLRGSSIPESVSLEDYIYCFSHFISNDKCHNRREMSVCHSTCKSSIVNENNTARGRLSLKPLHPGTLNISYFILYFYGLK